MKFFINYRRADSRTQAERLNDRLEIEFGKDAVFMDLDDIWPGEIFRSKIRDELEAADVVLVVIGPRWIDARDDKGILRLSHEDDPVRAEIRWALEAGKLVVPVLVDFAHLPDETSLPEDLRPLRERNTHSLAPDRFKDDADKLIRRLKHYTPLGERPNIGENGASRRAARARRNWFARITPSRHRLLAPEEVVARTRYLDTFKTNTSNRLAASIHSARFFDLGIADTPAATNLPWVYKNPADKREFTSIGEAVKLYKTRLLLLGPPGSGKTTTMLPLSHYS